MEVKDLAHILRLQIKLRLAAYPLLLLAAYPLLLTAVALAAQTAVTPETSSQTVPSSAASSGPQAIGSSPLTASRIFATTQMATVTNSRTAAAGEPTLPQQIAALPKLDGSGIDADARGADVLTHLNAVLRYYHESTMQAQKVGEPSDVLYSETAKSLATQISQFAFQAAKNEAALLVKIGGGKSTAPSDNVSDDEPQQQTQAQTVAALRARAQAKLTDLQTQDEALDKQISTAKPKNAAPLRQQDEVIEGQVELQKAMVEALNKVASMRDNQTPGTGLTGDIDRLLRTAPELGSAAAKTSTPAVLDSFNAVHEAGVSTQAVALFDLLDAQHTIDSRISDLETLTQQAEAMRAPMVKLLQATLAQGNELQTVVSPDGKQLTNQQTLDATRKHYDELSNTFRVLSAATMPISAEILLLEQAHSNLQSWRSTVTTEYNSILRSLLLRVVSIAIALIVLFVLSAIWQRLTVKYVKDVRRRRQFLVVRRVIVGFFSGLVLIFGFVTQFSSLATFAGFITAGIAVGLQTILLSVAAYFFIVGRYGVRVGDRITISGVTGDVVEVGLVRFYMMELTGTGNELHATGRVAVFANSVLFQAGVPLYKQMPGTEYAWHELTVPLKPDTDYRVATSAILKSVTKVYDTYRPGIEAQHKRVEAWMDSAIEAPRIEPRLQLADSGLQYAVLFPVEIKNAATTDEQMVQILLEDINRDEAVKAAVASSPTVKAVVKG